MASILPRLRLAAPASGSIYPKAEFDIAPVAIWLEIGFGAGEHFIAQAQAHPEIGLIGCEPFVNGVAGLLAQADGLDLANIRIVDDDARPILAVLPDASIDRVFVLFPDPWPKKRHHKRRFIGRESLAELARVMTDGAELRFASDHMGYVAWALEKIAAHEAFAWTARRPEDWRQRPADSFPTRYEEKALAKGMNPAYLTFVRRPRC
jgi:tRNA (guanine-N7-)-methyltransferase